MEEKKILIAEDDPDHAELIIEELNTEDIKMEFIIKKNGQEVIDYFRETDTAGTIGAKYLIDLIILDLNLPKIQGMDVLKFLKNNPKYRSIPTIIFSTSSDAETISEVYKNRADNFITKPTSFQEFTENVKLLKKYLLN